MTPRHFRSLALAGLVLGSIAASASAEDIIRQTFDAASNEALPTDAAPVGRVWDWTGPDQYQYGRIKLTSTHTPDGQGKAAEITNPRHDTTHAPVLAIDWQKTPAAERKGGVAVEYQFMVPHAAPYLSVHFFGGSWPDSALILCVEDGKLVLQYGEGEKRIGAGAYETGKWYKVRATFDPEKRLASVWINEKKIANDLPWQNGATSFEVVNITASNKPVLEDDKPVLYVDNIVVETVDPAAPSPAAK